MISYNYKTKNELWENDYLDSKSSYIEYVSSEERFNAEVYEFVHAMKQEDIHTIVNMNKYLTRNNLWNHFPTIATKNTYANGFVAIGVSKQAYSAIMKLHNTNDLPKTHLIEQHHIDTSKIAVKKYV